MMKKFGQLLIKGTNPSEAYGLAGYAVDGVLPTTVANNAYMLGQHSDVLAMVSEGNSAIQAAELLTREAGLLEAKQNLDGARLAKQWGPANQATKQRLELSGLTQEQPKIEMRITQVTIVMPGKSEPSHEEIIDV